MIDAISVPDGTMAHEKKKQNKTKQNKKSNDLVF